MNIVTRVVTIDGPVQNTAIIRAIAHAERMPDLFERSREAVALCFKADGSECTSILNPLAFTLQVEQDFDGTEGQDRESYSDTQDRETYRA